MPYMIDSSQGPSESGDAHLRDQLLAVRQRHHRLREDLAAVEVTASETLGEIVQLHDEVALELLARARADDVTALALQQELEAVADEVTDFAHHLTGRSRALHEEFDALHAEAQAIEVEAQHRQGVEGEGVGRVVARATEFHGAIESHRSALGTAAGAAGHALSDTDQHVTSRHQGLEQHLESLHQATTQAGSDSTEAVHQTAAHGHSAADDLREKLGMVGGLIAAATERLQREVEQSVEHEIHALIQEAVQEIRRMFDDLIARFGHSHAELGAARAIVEPLIHELESLIPGLQGGAQDAHAHVAEVERQREEMERALGYDNL